MVRTPPVGAYSLAYAWKAAQGDRARDRGRVPALAVPLAARGGRNATSRRARNTRSAAAVAGLRSAGQRVGAPDSGTAHCGLRPENPGPAVPERRARVGPHFTASGDARRSQRTRATRDADQRRSHNVLRA